MRPIDRSSAHEVANKILCFVQGRKELFLDNTHRPWIAHLVHEQFSGWAPWIKICCYPLYGPMTRQRASYWELYDDPVCRLHITIRNLAHPTPVKYVGDLILKNVGMRDHLSPEWSLYPVKA